MTDSAPPLKPLWPGFAYKPHQVKGVNWMLEREKEVGGILCDEMGLGKTIQMLGLLKERKGETLLLAPVAVIDQWIQAAKRARIACYRTHVTSLYTEWKPVTAVLPGAPRLFLSGYEEAKNRRELTAGRAWDRLVCDEAHRTAGKNAIHDLVADIEATTRWFLTATPVVNGLKDIQRLLELLGVELESSSATMDDLKPLLSRYVMARSMDDLRASIPDAPPKHTETRIVLPFASEDEAAFYKGMSGILVRRWRALEADGGGNALMKLQLFLRLRQLSLHPQVYIAAKRQSLAPLPYSRPDWEGLSTKFERMCQLVEEGATDGSKPHKWLIFCHFHTEMELLSKALKSVPAVRNVWLYSGAKNASERTEILTASTEPLPEGRADVLLVQLQSGGVGLNLQHFDRIIFGGPWWTSALMEQAIGRAVRIGQTEIVKVYHLLLEEEEAVNIDKVMREKVEEKGGLCRAVLESACRDC